MFQQTEDRAELYGSVIYVPCHPGEARRPKVEPVRSGVRKAAVTWVESHVRRADQREVLFDLDRLRRATFERDGKSAEFDLLAKTYANLLQAYRDALEAVRAAKKAAANPLGDTAAYNSAQAAWERALDISNAAAGRLSAFIADIAPLLVKTSTK